MKLYMDDEAFDGQLQRSVGKCDTGMANVGECLVIADAITSGDRDSWAAAWAGFGHRLQAEADEVLARGHRISARGRYLRAAEYLRQASFFHRDDLDDPTFRDAYRGSVAAFRAALPLLDHPAEVLEGELSGYLFTPAGATGRLPTILHIGGYDGTAEELYPAAVEALSRGWAFAAVDGPGQGATLYDQRVPMRPDWEDVVPGMVDALVAHEQVDPERIVLVGRSFGGYLAVRGAAGEPRLAACVVDPGQLDMGAPLKARLGDLMEKVDDPAAADQFESLLTIPAVKALFAPRMTTHGVSTAQAYCRDMVRYTSEGWAEKVACPTFVTDNETDLISTGQGEQLFALLTCPKRFRRFTKAEGADGHCEGMAPTVFWAAAFDWLDETVT